MISWIASIFPHVILLLCVSLGISVAAATSGNESDYLALLDFKNHVTGDPLSIMSTWNDSFHFCDWVGVTCNSSNKRVMVLNLEARHLTGSVPSSIGNLSYLTGLNLRNNSFHGEIPQEIGLLRYLLELKLTYNYLRGKIPTNLDNCTQLTWFEAISKDLTGEIPNQLTSLSSLVVLGLTQNKLTGNIPAWIANISSLSKLSIASNNSQGTIPQNIGDLHSLTFSNFQETTCLSMVWEIMSIYGDIYSFDIVLLEIFTGRKPTDGIFGDGVDIHDFVKMALPNTVSEVFVDPLFGNRGVEEEEDMLYNKECMMAILEVGVNCSMKSPQERMKEKDVIKELQRIKRILMSSYIN